MGNGSSSEIARREMFERIADKLKTTDPNIVKKLGGVYLFCVMRKQTVRYWTMDLDKVLVYPGEPEDDREPDATVTLTEETLQSIAEGRVGPRAAVQAGKCSVTGNIMKAMSLEPYIKL